MLGEFPGAGRAEEGVGRHGMGVADEVHSRQGKQVGVEKGFDRGLALLRPEAGGEQAGVDLGVGQALFAEEGEDGVKTALGHAVGSEGCQVAAAGLDREAALVETDGGIAFPENGEAAVFPPEFAGEAEHLVEEGGCHGPV